MPKVTGYDEKNYKQDKNLYDSLAQSFSDLKNKPRRASWNVPGELLKGCNMRTMGEDKLELTYMCHQVGTHEDLIRIEDEGYKFVDELSKELKKLFKEKTGKALKMKEIKKIRDIEKTSMLSAETSWMLGSSRYGTSPIGRYLIRYRKVFEFSSTLEPKSDK
jgi:hypothetical protein